MRWNDLCSDHNTQRQLSLIRRRHVPAISPGLPLLTFDEPRDCADLLVSLNLLIAALANGTLDPSRSIPMTAFLRTCNRTLHRMSQLRALRAGLSDS
jgi:hypothetical protein